MATINLIDGDVLCYLACYERYRGVHADANAFNENDAVKNAVMVGETDVKFMEQAWENFQKELTALQELTFSEHFLMSVKGPNNFRDILYPDYKKQRKPNVKESAIAPFVQGVRDLAVITGLAIPSDGRETDDYLRIWRNETVAAGDDCIISSIDKDLLIIPGVHFNIKKREFTEVTQVEAWRNLYEQILKGDSTDNIPGLPGIGPVKAKSLLAGCKTEKEMQEVVCVEYFTMYGPDSFKDYLLSNGKLLYLQQHCSDFFQVSHWDFFNIF